jgi:hypothetical protein
MYYQMLERISLADLLAGANLHCLIYKQDYSARNITHDGRSFQPKARPSGGAKHGCRKTTHR